MPCEFGADEQNVVALMGWIGRSVPRHFLSHAYSATTFRVESAWTVVPGVARRGQPRARFRNAVGVGCLAPSMPFKSSPGNTREQSGSAYRTPQARATS